MLKSCAKGVSKGLHLTPVLKYIPLPLQYVKLKVRVLSSRETVVDHWPVKSMANGCWPVWCRGARTAGWICPQSSRVCPSTVPGWRTTGFHWQSLRLKGTACPARMKMMKDWRRFAPAWGHISHSKHPGYYIYIKTVVPGIGIHIIKIIRSLLFL